MKYSTGWLTLILVPLLVNTAAAQGFSISPSRIVFTGNPGQTVTQPVIFSNSSPNILYFINQVQDWERDSLGTKIYYEGNTRPLSNAKWIGLSSNSVSLKPGEIKQVIVSLTIPAEARQLTHSMIFFSQVKEQKASSEKGTSIGISILMEVGVQVYYQPKGLNTGEFEFLAFEDRGTVDNGGKKFRRMAVRIHNKAEVNKDAALRFELTSKESGEEIKFDPQMIAMLPEATQWVLVDLPANLKGKYLAVALLDAGSTYDLKVAEKEILYRP